MAASQVPSSSHRLPTRSALDALLDAHNDEQVAITTGLEQLDQILSGDNGSSIAGIDRGKVTEIWGPSGSGKSLLALQIARETLKTAGSVVWFDASKPLTSPNLEKLGQNATEAAPANEAETSTPFLPTVLHRITLHTLSHLVALVLHPTESFPPPNTKLVVIESLNMVLDQDYPRLPYLTGTRTESQKWKASRRYAVLGSLASGLTALAALYNMAVIVTTGCSNRTRFEDGMNAALAPGIGGAEWETGVWNRLAMFHDFAGRFIGVQKFHGKNLQPTNPVGHIGIVTEFEIVDGGQLRHPSNDLQRPDGLVAARSILAASSSPAKSGLKRAYDEVADSDDDEIDEYGWAEADDEAAAIADIIVLGERPVQEARPAEEVEATADQDRPEAPPAEASPSPTV